MKAGNLTVCSKLDCPVQTFEELTCYQKARELIRAISCMARELPREEAFRLRDQILRSSRSVTANIAEGYGRHHHQENAQFCRQARGSLTETLDHLNVALDEGLVEAGSYSELRSLLEDVWRVLNGYIAYLARCARTGVPDTGD